MNTKITTNRVLLIVVIIGFILIYAYPADAKIVDFREKYQDYLGDQYLHTNENLVSHPRYSIVDNGNNYTITRFGITKDLPKQYTRNNITFNITYQFLPDRIIPAFQINNYSQISNFVFKLNATAWYIPFPWKASQYLSFTDDLIDMGVFQRTTKVTVRDSNGTEYQVLPKVNNNEIRLWFNPQTYSGVIYPLTITENTITVSNTTTSSWSASNVSLNNSRFSGDGNLSIALNSSYFSGLVLDMDMQETAGIKVRNVNNASGLFNVTNECTWNGNPTINTTANPLGGTAINFSIDDSLTCGTDSSLGGMTSLTLEIDVKPFSLDNGLITPGNTRFVLRTVTSAGYIITNKTDGTGSGYLAWNTGLTLNTWNDGIALYNGTGMALFKNGVRANSKTFASPFGALRDTGAFPIIIGGNIGSGGYLNGSVKRVRVWNNRSLSENEISVLSSTPLQTQANITIWQQNSTYGYVVNRTRLHVSNWGVNNNTVDLSYKSNTTSAWTSLITNITNGTWIYFTQNFSSVDFLVTLNGNGSSTPYYTYLEWDEVNPPSSVSSLGGSSTSPAEISWGWINPPEANFDHTEIYFDGSFVTSTSNTAYSRNSLIPDTQYTLSLRTVDTAGNINSTWTNYSVRTQGIITSGGSVSGGGGSSGSSRTTTVPYVPSSTPTPTPTVTYGDYEQFTPSISPYQPAHPFEIGIHSIEFSPPCTSPVFLNKTDNNMFLLSQCTFSTISINFLAPPNFEVSQLIGGQWNILSQKIIAKTSDEKYYVVHTDVQSLGIFKFSEKTKILPAAMSVSFKDGLRELDGLFYEYLIRISKTIEFYLLHAHVN